MHNQDRMKSIMGLLLLPLLTNGELGNTIEDAVNSKMLGALVSQQSPVESAATIAHTSPFGSVASMGPMVVDFGMPYVSPYGSNFPMPYASPVMGVGAPFSPLTPYMNPYSYSGIGMPVIPPMAFPAYTSANPLMSRLAVHQHAMPFASASEYGYY